jgi:hypothetical protein
MERGNGGRVVRVESQLDVARKLRHVVYIQTVTGDVIPPWAASARMRLVDMTL